VLSFSWCLITVISKVLERATYALAASVKLVVFCWGVSVSGRVCCPDPAPYGRAAWSELESQRVYVHGLDIFWEETMSEVSSPA